MKPYEKEWDDYWSKIVLDESGIMDVEQLKKELWDYSILYHNTMEVVRELTDGMITKPQSKPETIIDVVTEHQTKKATKRFVDDMFDFIWENSTIDRDKILDYIIKTYVKNESEDL